MKLIFVMLGFLVFAQSCSSSDISLGSHCDTTYKFSKKIPIFLTVPNNPSAIEESNFSAVKEALVKSGFTLVDSATRAKRFLTYYIRVGQTNTHTTMINESIVEKRFDSGLTQVTLAMFDAIVAQDKKQKMVWQAVLQIPDKDYEKAPLILLCKLLKLYGKNKVEYDSFKPPK